jgi:hypothetical protein
MIGKKNTLQATKMKLNFHVIASRAIGAVCVNITVKLLAHKRAIATPLARILVGRTSAAYAYGEEPNVAPKKNMKTMTIAIPAFPQTRTLLTNLWLLSWNLWADHHVPESPVSPNLAENPANMQRQMDNRMRPERNSILRPIRSINTRLAMPPMTRQI